MEDYRYIESFKVDLEIRQGLWADFDVWPGDKLEEFEIEEPPTDCDPPEACVTNGRCFTHSTED